MIKKPSVIFTCIQTCIQASKGHQETSEICYFYMSLLNAIRNSCFSPLLVNPRISIVKVAKVGVLPHGLRK